jgi:hypothetical protein
MDARPLARAAALGLAALLAAACTQIVGDFDESSSTKLCGQCMTASCSAQYSACEQNAACISLVQCLNACGPQTFDCNQCSAEYPGGVADLAALANCGCSSCPVCECSASK